jgi:LysR family transcriptional regulator, glycine cleavage system transcriptional activator
MFSNAAFRKAKFNMSYRLPSIFALQAFEAVARHRSFKKAAEELNLTPGAISQKISKLEQWLDVILLERTTQGVTVSPLGEVYLKPIRQAILQISDATKSIRQKNGASVLTISLIPSFAIKWLIPRLGSFYANNQKITINIRSTEHLVNFSVDNVDAAVRHGLGHYEGLKSHRLFSETLVPVCSPTLLAGKHPLRELGALRHHRLLHDSAGKDWGLLLSALGVEGVDAEKGPRFSDDGLVLQAAIEGQGVALGRRALVARDLEKGSLVAPFSISMPSEFAHYLVYPEERGDGEALAAFREWLIAEARTGGDV